MQSLVMALAFDIVIPVAPTVRSVTARRRSTTRRPADTTDRRATGSVADLDLAPSAA